MDNLKTHAYKSRAIKKHKGQQLLNDFILYSLTALACTSFCSSPLWYPPFCATFNVFFFFSLPKITSFFFTSKALFIFGNLIVIFLLGESKFFASKPKDYDNVCQDTYECKRLDQLQVISSSQEQKGEKATKSITPKVEMQVKLLEYSKAYEDNEHEEYFEVDRDEETCESNVDQMDKPCGPAEGELSCSGHELRVVEEEKDGGIEGDTDSLPADDLNKKVDDFIAKINRQRMLEAEFCRG